METYFSHADEAETSLGLYLVPELVDMTKAKDMHNPAKALLSDKWVLWPLAGKGVTEQFKTKLPMHYVFTGHRREREDWPPNTLHVRGYATKATRKKGGRL